MDVLLGKPNFNAPRSPRVGGAQGTNQPPAEVALLDLGEQFRLALERGQPADELMWPSEDDC